MEPAHAPAEEVFPTEITGFELRGRFVAPVIKNDRRADSSAAIAVHGCDVRTVDAIVFEFLIESPDTHGPHPFGDEISNRIIHHRSNDARLHPKAIGKIGGDIEFTAANVDLAFGGFAERDDTRIKPVNQCAESKEVQRPFRRNIQAVLHRAEVASKRTGCLAENVVRCAAGRILAPPPERGLSSRSNPRRSHGSSKRLKVSCRSTLLRTGKSALVRLK